MSKTTPANNALFYGDNLDILRKYISNESVDLVYLDPPLNSNANYNVLFRAPSGESSQSQSHPDALAGHIGIQESEEGKHREAEQAGFVICYPLRDSNCRWMNVQWQCNFKTILSNSIADI